MTTILTDLGLPFVATGVVDDGSVMAPAVRLLLGRLHPMVVHFPIALLITAAGLELLGTLRRGKPRSRAVLPCLLIGTIGAMVAAWFGWLNAEMEPPGSSYATTLFIHRWSGVAVAVLSTFTLCAVVCHRWRGWVWAGNVSTAGLLVTAALVTVGGHFGAQMVYGSGYLLSAMKDAGLPVPGKAPAAEVVAAVPATPGAPEATPTKTQTTEPGVSGALGALPEVRDILATRCESCHGPRRQKGGLRLDDLAAGFAGGWPEYIVVPGNAAESELINRVVLPPDDPDHMPAKGDPLTPAQIATITAWIDAGAPVETPPPAPPVAPTPEASKKTGAAPAPAVDRAQRDAALARLRERGAYAVPIALDADTVDVNLSLLGAEATDETLSLLSGLEPTLTWLNLSGTAVTDDGIARLRDFRTLTRLRLDRTSVGDGALSHLTTLANLSSLNLVGTRVSDAGVPGVQAIPGLRQVYMWDTRVTKNGAARLRAARPELSVILGDELAPPPEPEVPASDQ